MTPAALTVPLDEMASCFEGIIPTSICTVSPDGMPNVTYLSVVHRIDATHVALSRQFFKKTEENELANPYAQIGLVEPGTGRQFRLDLVYEGTETEGLLFERMRTKLDAVAANEGMSNVFRLRGVDICKVIGSEMLPTDNADGAPRRDVKLDKVESFSSRISASGDLDDLLRTTLRACDELLEFRHVFVMMLDESGERLYTVASTGYPESGAGSEVRIGEGLIGVSAARRVPVRLTNMARELSYTLAARESLPEGVPAVSIEQAIPLPSLPSVKSQMVIPMLAYHQLVGVLSLQSDEPGAFQAADECAMAIIANQVAMAMATVNLRAREVSSAAPAAPAAGGVIQVKHYSEDDSVFIDNEYLIKGVAGGILWRLLRSYQDEHRNEFSNKEIRLDQSLDLPEIKDNLEARLILLRKRLEERSRHIRVEKTARGRFRLVVERPLVLAEAEGGSPV